MRGRGGGDSVYKPLVNDCSLCGRIFVEPSAHNFEDKEISGQAQSLARNGHPSIW